MATIRTRFATIFSRYRLKIADVVFNLHGVDVLAVTIIIPPVAVCTDDGLPRASDCMKPHTSLLKAADLVSYPEIGLPSIDDEHRLLLQQLDALIANTEATPDTEHFTSVLGVLGRLLSEHFSHEEEALRTLGMPPEDVDGHLKAHNSIIEQYTQLNFDLMSRLPVQRHDALVMFKEWLIGHFLKYDMKIKSHLPTVPATRYDG